VAILPIPTVAEKRSAPAVATTSYEIGIGCELSTTGFCQRTLRRPAFVAALLLLFEEAETLAGA
jgi:hypothetical protein